MTDFLGQSTLGRLTYFLTGPNLAAGPLWKSPIPLNRIRSLLGQFSNWASGKQRLVFLGWSALSDDLQNSRQRSSVGPAQWGFPQLKKTVRDDRAAVEI